MSDFNHAILEDTAHRPWPMRQDPWVMTQTWHDLLFAHWPVPVAALRAQVPRAFPIDVFAGQAWIGVVPFHMTNVAPRLVPPVPWLSAFPELNVRTYVTVGGRAGVYFFSLDAGSAVAVATARTLLHLPYFTAHMSVTSGSDIRYSSRRADGSAAPAEFEGRYQARGSQTPPVPGTLEHFLTERYCLYAIDHSGRPYRLDIHHPPWPLQRAEAQISRNTMTTAAGIPLPSDDPLLHFSKRQDMVCWLPQRLSETSD